MSLEEFEKYFAEYQLSTDLPKPSWNIKPTQQIAILLEDHKQAGLKRAESARWALTPSWSKTLATRTPLFNARIETVLEKPSFKASARNRRCLIPATGYYEWTGPKAERVPHYIHLQNKPLLFAGIYSWWHDKEATSDEAWHLTATILTMDSYGPMQPIHDRMPVFMNDNMAEAWLDPKVEGVPELFKTVSSSSHAVGERLIEYPVDPLKGDDPSLILP